MRNISTLVARLVMVTTLGAFAVSLAEAQSRAPTPVPTAPATRVPDTRADNAGASRADAGGRRRR